MLAVTWLGTAKHYSLTGTSSDGRKSSIVDSWHVQLLTMKALNHHSTTVTVEWWLSVYMKQSPTCVTPHSEWSERIYQLTKAQYLGHLRVAVHHRLVLDLPCSVGISECPKSLLCVGVCWTNARYHQCVTVTSKRVCQHHMPTTSAGPNLNVKPKLNTTVFQKLCWTKTSAFWHFCALKVTLRVTCTLTFLCLIWQIPTFCFMCSTFQVPPVVFLSCIIFVFVSSSLYLF